MLNPPQNSKETSTSFHHTSVTQPHVFQPLSRLPSSHFFFSLLSLPFSLKVGPDKLNKTLQIQNPSLRSVQCDRDRRPENTSRSQHLSSGENPAAFRKLLTKMEFNNGSGSDSSNRNQTALSRSFLSIDLNKIPSPASESLPSPSLSVSPISLVRSFHDNPAPPEGLPAEIPGEGCLGPCGACGLLEVRGQVVVCDGCERGFHFLCAGMKAVQAAAVEEWVCAECRSGGVGSRRWPLGRKLGGGGGGIRLLDINASPPSDADVAGNGEEEVDLLGIRDSRYDASRLCSVSSAATLTGGSFSDGLPIQYEDFFLLSIGDVDARPTYHDASCIWPVGYRSCWHDKITGSLFLCYVVDGGEAGPLFKIRRFSCSSLPIPYGSTILHRKKIDTKESEEGDRITCPSPVYEDDCSVDTMLCEPSLPVDDDVLSWLRNCSFEAYDAQKLVSSQDKDNSFSKGSQKSLGTNLFVGDKIDEFSIDGLSSSAVWSILSQKLIDACSLIYNRTGSLRFFCKHAEDGASSLCYNVEVKKNKGIFSCLDKYCSLLGTINIPSIVRNDQEFELASKVLKNWMNLDRFGLDVGFVQEVIEQLPSIGCCLQYRSLKCRNDYSITPLVGNGLLLVNAKGKACDQETALDNSEHACQSAKKGMVAKAILANRCLPSGKLLGAKLPPQLVGDILQARELLLRFHDILGLEGALPFDDLEAELISPWCDNSCPSEQSERSLEDDQTITRNVSREIAGQTSSSSSEIDISKGNPHIFIEVETRAVKQEADAQVASSTFSRCTGILLRKVHVSLLNVLLSELLLKVAAILDPTLDGGESKQRRGRRKEVDSSNLAKRSKLSILPINALTWPDLARRYLLSVLCMDGNLDSTESTVRESSKVFRCLQGDGGVLCGSLAGLAGIEADALLLAEARKRIYGSLNTAGCLLSIEDVEVEAISTSANEEINDGGIPEWANELEPVRKLPTNVGTRIRKCVYAALEKDPPEWARKILEHSISKAVYKGNASGPTKKAVLSVLATVCGGAVPQKPPKEKKKKRVLSIPDIVMRQCRILLRHTASEDDEKVFCNLLGRNLMNSSDNDDEGLIGCPGMVSRPLDFRTIDLRLAFGSYGGSHEAFREDVCELWSNIRTVYVDQSDVMKLVERVSQKFDSLYEEEVVSLVEKLNKFAQLERIDPEAKKELADIVTSTSEIPKAPWGEGICKVCGIDKDDDSVLLCDKCDAEYHTYCLNPPLARIPEGNWYCPSCVSGGKSASKSAPLLSQRRRKRYQSDIIQCYLEELSSLAAMMEETEYWDFNVHERTLLLKFLCDELLNSSQIRQHLEQCAETSVDLQQKLRSLYSEIKILKLREDLLLSRAAKVSQNPVNVAVDANIDSQTSGVVKHSSSAGIQSVVSNKLLHVGPSSDDKKTTDLETKQYNDTQNQLQKPVDAQNQPEEIDMVIDDDSESNRNHTERPKKRHKAVVERDSMSNSRSQEVNGIANEASHQSVKVLEATRSDLSGLPISDAKPGVTISSSGSGQLAESVSPVNLNDKQVFNLELNSIRKNISVTQQSIADVETHLLKLSIRMEFLGNDFAGRLYWLSAKPGEYPLVIVDGTMALQRGKQRVDGKAMPGIGSVFKEVTPSGNVDLPNLEGSNATCPFSYEAGISSVTCSQWTSYQSDSEVKSLVEWFRKDDPKEKELKDSVLHWQKLRIFVSLQAGKVERTDSMALLRSNGKNDTSNYIVTKASTVLEKMYGPCFEANMDDNFKREWKKARLTGGGKMYRCKCLEPIWVSRQHCFRCHKTFLIAAEFDKHNNGHCSSGTAALEKKKESSEPSDSRAKSESHIVGASKSTGLELSSGLIHFQNEGLTCPFRFEEISSKFVTNDSIKELVQNIGLLGSDGKPEFVQSFSPHLSEPKLVFAPSYENTHNNQSTTENEVASQGIDARSKVQLGSSHGISAIDKCSENLKTDRSLPGTLVSWERNIFSSRRGLSSEASHCCVVRESSLRPLVGRAAQILKHLKFSLLDIEAAIPEEALRPSRVHMEKRCAWRSFVKSSETIFELVQSTIVLEDMIKAEYLRNEWYYWSSLSAAARTSTLSALALRIYSLDNAIVYEKNSPKDINSKSSDVDQQPHIPNSDSSEKPRSGRRNSRKRKETDG
ncbi:hypothetical protein V2J09_023032 [Rumex salicifolius]